MCLPVSVALLVLVATKITITLQGPSGDDAGIVDLGSDLQVPGDWVRSRLAGLGLRDPDRVPEPPNDTPWVWHVGTDRFDFGELTGDGGRGSKTRHQFNTGVGLLYSFLYARAAEQFDSALLGAPEQFPMALWGKAMSCIQPLWMSETLSCGHELQLIQGLLSGDGTGITRRESMYLRLPIAYLSNQTSVPRSLRQRRFRRAALDLYQEFPNDLNAASFAALAIITDISPGEAGAERRGKEGTVTVLGKTQDLWSGARGILDRARAAPGGRLHPHVLHIWVHLSDTPRAAAAALREASLYPAVAPSAPHARHMPSHLALRVGRWALAERQNKAAIRVSLEYSAATGRFPVSEHFDGHSAMFLHYALLQQGKYSEAERLVVQAEIMRQPNRLAHMAALGFVEACRYKQAGALAAAQELPPAVQCETCLDDRNLDDMFLWSADSNAGLAYARGLAEAYATKSSAAARRQIIAIANRVNGSFPTFAALLSRVAALHIDATAETNATSSIAILEQSFESELDLGPPADRPLLLQPTAEFLARAYLDAGRPADALRVLDESDKVLNVGRTQAGLLRVRALMALSNVSAACSTLRGGLDDTLLNADTDGCLAVDFASAKAALDCSDF